MHISFMQTLHIDQILLASFALFAVIDPIGSIPLYLKFKNKIGYLNASRITFSAGFIMMLFLFTGSYILQVFDISNHDFSVAGALILFILGLEMVLNIEIFKLDTTNMHNASLTPIAFPIIVGPGTLSTLVALQAHYPVTNIILALIINLIVLYIVLRFLVYIETILKKIDLINILHKLMGIILMAMAIKLFKIHFFA